MEKILVKGYGFQDLVLVPKEVASNLKKHQRIFDRWLKSQNKYIMIGDQGEKVNVFTSDAFIDYINDEVVNDKKSVAYIIEEDYELVEGEEYPSIFF